VVERASGILSTISICDHDTLSAYPGLDVPERLNLLPGIEMTCQVGDSDLHLLAYFPAGLCPTIHDWALTLENDRRTRVIAGVSRLRESGIPIGWDQLEAELQGGVPCRSHVARALVSAGICTSLGLAYRQWLGPDSFRRPELEARAAIEQVHQFDGLVYWAHPFGDDVVQYGQLLISAGLDGVETLSQNLSPENRRIAREFQRAHRLGECGGSDLHSETPRRKIGQYAVEESRIDERLIEASRVK
jgi:predicted metal-dependent phosphoesterase TrpH